MTVEVLTAHALADVPHGFLGRRGGVSEGAVAGLNCGLGSGDDPAAVEENRRRAVEAVVHADAPQEAEQSLRPSRAQWRGVEIVSLYQIHSADVVTVTTPWPSSNRPRADALVTDRPGLLLSIVTADCAPILFADAEVGVVGAAHAGWQGALARVAENTVAAMEKLGARRGRIAAAVGPCIARASYEVDWPFLDRFTAADPANDRFFTEGPAGKPHFDLETYVLARLASAGLTRIEALGQDTYAQEDRFYSYRRATHRGEPHYGRQISLIGVSSV